MLFLRATVSSLTFKYSCHSLISSLTERLCLLNTDIFKHLTELPIELITICKARKPDLCVQSSIQLPLPLCFYVYLMVCTNFIWIQYADASPPNKPRIWWKAEGRKLTEPRWPLYIIAKSPGFCYFLMPPQATWDL